MKITIPNFRKSKVMIIGDVMLDQYYYGITNETFLEKKSPIFKISSIKKYPGGAANVAMNVNSLGSDTYLFGLVGKDNNAEILCNILKKSGVQFKFMSFSNQKTTTKTRIINNNKQLIRIDSESNFKQLNFISILENIQSKLSNINVVILSDYQKGALKYITEIISSINSYKIPILVDPKGINFKKYRGATILTPNFSEFEAMAGPIKNEKTMINIGMKLIYECDLSALLITRSEKGMTLLQPEKKPINFLPESKKDDIRSFIGAGDTVISVLASSIASGMNIEDACYLANIAAGEVIRKPDTSTVNISELKKLIFALKKY